MNTTIAAISTAYGEGGIGIVRISGDKSSEILDGLFYGNAAGASGNNTEVSGERTTASCERNTTSENETAASDKRAVAFNNRQLYYGKIREPKTGETVDEVLVVYMKGPKTYTGEDVVEIHCHGSTVSLRKIMELACSNGAEPAEKGEFTKRAFLNGRIDLTQAEAVIDIVRAKTDESMGAAVKQLEGGMSKEISELRNLLADTLAEEIVNMDYPDEDEKATEERSAARSIKTKLEKISAEISGLINTSETGRKLREGISVVIAGKANVGKSSLLNAILRESRAIVSDFPGTTRDSIEELIDVKGVPVKICDTAGIRQAKDEVEKIGVDRSEAVLKNADLVILVLDGSSLIDNEDRQVFSLAADKKILVAINKSDLPEKIDADDIPKGYDSLRMSAKTGEGIRELEEYIVSEVFGGRLSQKDSLLLTNIRQRDLLVRARKELEEAISAVSEYESPDFAELNTRVAWELLGEITGETATEDILDNVFENFCVGK